MSTPQSILDLIRRFDDNAAEYRGEASQYRSPAYNETETRREFIDPLFKALGWDVDNTQGYSEKYKEVVHEARVTVGGRVKAPDYAFRVGGRPVFFVEAKRPGVMLHAGREADESAFQVRRYAWSAKLPVSVLTNFTEFALYDCRSKPARSEGAGIGRVAYYTHAQFPDVWDDLAGLLAPEAIRKGALDRFIASEKATRGTLAVDTAFLAEIEGWRDTLARNIALRNPGLTVRQLNFAVQKTIDRLIFLRIAEDRGFEPYHRLGDLAQGKDVYRALGEVFRQADNRYNAGLFYFRPEAGRDADFDDFTLDLQVDDKTLKDILTRLYYPESPYAFDALPADILGQVYEQFLGKVIRLTAGGRAKVEEKPEVKKAGGVYYTPTYIVDYIVEHTVGTLLEGKTWREVRGLDARGVQRYAPLRVLDPACGSGTFLLQAYQYLLDWYLEQYTADDSTAHAKAGRISPPLSPPTGGTKAENLSPSVGERGRSDSSLPPSGGERGGAEWRLTTEARKDILLTHLYGVDIDPQAVEVTKLSLLLKVLEGEDEQSLGQQLTMSLGNQERVLPDLGQNIRCGNSLIGPDYYQGQQLGFGLLDDEEMYRINAFDWEQGFHAAMMAGGFDAVIGNPPWISLSGKYGVDIHSKEETNYLVRKYRGNTYMPNMYEYFVTQGFNLTKQGGMFSFIVPDRLGFNDQFIGLRRKILNESGIVALLYKVPFPSIVADTLIFVFRKGRPSPDHKVEIREYETKGIQIQQTDLLNDPTFQFKYFESDQVYSIIRKSRSSPLVSNLIQVCRTTSGFGGKSSLVTENCEHESQIPVFRGRSIDRYRIRQRYWFEFKPENITGRTTDTVKLGASPKVLLRKTGDRIIATYDNSGTFPEQSLYFLYDNQSQMDYKYLLGILNSRLLTFYYRTVSLTNIKSIAQVKKTDLDQLPIRTIDFDDPADVARHDRMVALVERMLDLHRRLAAAKLAHEKHLLQQQIDVTDKAIDTLVYELYDLTPEEIEIIEGAAA